MTTISLRLPDTTVEELNIYASNLNLSRSEYIKQAIECMNKELKRNEMHKRLKQASALVRNESMKINSEFNKVEYDPKA